MSLSINYHDVNLLLVTIVFMSSQSFNSSSNTNESYYYDMRIYVEIILDEEESDLIPVKVLLVSWKSYLLLSFISLLVAQLYLFY